MAKTYPNIGSSSKRKEWMTKPVNAPMCDVEGCECRATHRVEVQVNWFRGDDEVGNACEAHCKDAGALEVGIPAARIRRREQQLAADLLHGEFAYHRGQGAGGVESLRKK